MTESLGSGPCQLVWVAKVAVTVKDLKIALVALAIHTCGNIFQTQHIIYTLPMKSQHKMENLLISNVSRCLAKAYVLSVFSFSFTNLQSEAV